MKDAGRPIKAIFSVNIEINQIIIVFKYQKSYLKYQTPSLMIVQQYKKRIPKISKKHLRYPYFVFQDQKLNKKIFEIELNWINFEYTVTKNIFTSIGYFILGDPVYTG